MTRQEQIKILKQYREELLLIKAQQEGKELPSNQETKEYQKVLVLKRNFYSKDLKM